MWENAGKSKLKNNPETNDGHCFEIIKKCYAESNIWIFLAPLTVLSNLWGGELNTTYNGNTVFSIISYYILSEWIMYPQIIKINFSVV